MWDRRQFITGLGLATLGACKRAPTSTVEPTAPPVTPPIDSMPPPVDAEPDANNPTRSGEPINPGYLRMGRSPLQFDGEELLELRQAALIRRTAALAEMWTIPFAGPQSFAVLQDRSIVVSTDGSGERKVHHVVGDKIAISTASRAKFVLPTASPNVFWAVAAKTLKRTEIGSTSERVDFFLPENAHPMTAQALSDGSIVMAENESLLRFDRTMTKLAWDDPAEFLAAGPDATSVWSAHSAGDPQPAHLVLRKLAGGTAKAVALHKLAEGEQFVHLSSAETDAAAIVAKSVRANEAALTLIVFDAKGERWRAALGDRSGGSFVALSPTRVVVLADKGVLRVWNRATGKPA